MLRTEAKEGLIHFSAEPDAPSLHLLLLDSAFPLKSAQEEKDGAKYFQPIIRERPQTRLSVNLNNGVFSPKACWQGGQADVSKKPRNGTGRPTLSTQITFEDCNSQWHLGCTVLGS